MDGEYAGHSYVKQAASTYKSDYGKLANMTTQVMGLMISDCSICKLNVCTLGIGSVDEGKWSMLLVNMLISGYCF